MSTANILAIYCLASGEAEKMNVLNVSTVCPETSLQLIGKNNPCFLFYELNM